MPVTIRTRIRARVIPRWPSRVLGTTGVKAVRSGTTVTLSLDTPTLTTSTTPLGTWQSVFYDPTNSVYRKVPLSNQPAAATFMLSQISDMSADARAFNAAIDNNAMRTALGLGSAALSASTAFAPFNASFLTLGTDGTLSNERVLTAGTAIGFTDGGAGGTLTVAVNDAELVAFAGLTSGANLLGYFTGSGTMTTTAFTVAGRSMVGAADANAQTALLSNMVGDSGAGGTKGLVPAPASGDAAAGKVLYANGLWAVPPGASGGEANTASNVGTGAGVFKSKTGVDLAFKSLIQPAAGLTLTGNTNDVTIALADDLSALEALAGTDTIYRRSAANTWSAVTFGDGMRFASGVIAGPVEAGQTSNLTLVASVASNILTIAVKTIAAADPSASDPVTGVFASATEASGALVVRTIAAALSIAIPDTALVGTANATAFRYWVVWFDDAGTNRLGVINCRDSSNNIYPLGGWGNASSTTIGTGSDSAHVFYTGSGVTTKPYIVLGYVEYDAAGLVTAGTYASAPDRIRMHQRGMKLPGDVVQSKMTTYATNADLSTAVPVDDTIPQSGEGTQVASHAMTLDSPANKVEIDYGGFGGCASAVSVVFAAFSSLSANAIHVGATFVAAGGITDVHPMCDFFPNSAASVTYSLRVGASATIRLNGTTAGRLFGGSSAAYLRTKEVMA